MTLNVAEIVDRTRDGRKGLQRTSSHKNTKITTNGLTNLDQKRLEATCILSRVKQITSPGWMHDKRLDLVHWEDLEGSGGEGGGRGDRDGEYMYIHGCFISLYDKIHYK